MRFAYADPPYIGQARKLYRTPEVDHHELLSRLNRDYPDGWALSASSPSLPALMAMPEMLAGIHIGAWVKPFCSFKPGVNPAYAWEPIIFFGGRRRGRDLPTLRDYVVCNITLRKGLVGAKPAEVCSWILDFLNAQPGDVLDDLYPGTGIMGRVARERGLLDG